MRKDKSLKETKVLLTEKEDKQLDKIATAEGKSKTSFCTYEIRKIISERVLAVRQKNSK